jgi:hypothetical protein
VIKREVVLAPISGEAGKRLRASFRIKPQLLTRVMDSSSVILRNQLPRSGHARRSVPLPQSSYGNAAEERPDLHELRQERPDTNVAGVAGHV